MNISTSTWDPMIIYITVQKLDYDTHKDWESHVSREYQTELPTLQNMITFLDSRIHTLELTCSPSSSSQKSFKTTERSCHSSAVNIMCKLCKGQHLLCHCKEFVKLDPEKKSEVVKSNRLCYNCLSPGHPVYYCKQKTSCKICGKRHHSLLHHSKKREDFQDTEKNATTPEISMNTLNEQQENLLDESIIVNFAHKQRRALLATALVPVRSKCGREATLRALIDPGSQASFISENASQLIRLKKTPVQCSITGIGSTTTPVRYVDQHREAAAVSSQAIGLASNIIPSWRASISSGGSSVVDLSFKKICAWNNRFFRENPAFLSVQVGSDYYEAGGEDIPVFEVYFHPDYSPKTLNNNLALMRLSVHIVFSKIHKSVRRVQFDRSPTPLPVNTDGIVIVGWGAKDNDLGGPGLSNGILVGVISFGPPTCGTPDAPTVFTKVGFYKDWIDEIIKMPVPAVNRLTTLRQPKRTIAMHYSDRTTRTFKLTPFREFAKEYTSAPYNIRMNLPKDTLRILEDGKLFKEFLSNMFGNNVSEHEVSNLSKVKTKKDAGRKVKSKLKTSTSAAHSILPDIEEDIGDDVSDFAEVKTNSNTSASIPPLLYDNGESGAESIEIKKKKNRERKLKSKSTTTARTSLMLYDYNDGISDLTEVKTKKVAERKRKILSTISSSTELPILYDVTVYKDQNSKENKDNTEEFELNSDVLNEGTKQNKGKNNENYSKFNTATIKQTDDDIKDLDIEELMRAIIETNTDTKNLQESILEADSNDQDLNLDNHIRKFKTTKTKQTFSTTRSPLQQPDEEEYVDEYDEKYQSKMKTTDETDNTVNNAMDNTEDSTLEKDINDLLDHLDLRKLLESEESARLHTEKNKKDTQDIQKPKPRTVLGDKKNEKLKAKEAQIASYSYEITGENSGEVDFDA
ncbi:unnamed protein product [Arctia plantaginis]|uniref:Peptidase S1 domain-containing protein n=1 Tax=Arctia plantaginis TaxID=874455 RepID=A0A8S1AC50_ARCPL|nr:unnamed protein product [Arctia plantaginis]